MPERQLRVKAHGKQLERTESCSCFRNKIKHVLLCCGLLSFMLSNLMCLECLEAAVFQGHREPSEKIINSSGISYAVDIDLS